MDSSSELSYESTTEEEMLELSTEKMQTKLEITKENLLSKQPLMPSFTVNTNKTVINIHPITFTTQRRIFKAQHHIKLLKANNTHTVVIDTFNIISVLDSQSEPLKILFFPISDAVFLNTHTLLLCAHNTGILKELDLLTLTVQDIFTNTLCPSKIVIEEYIYLIGEGVSVLDRSTYEVIRVVKCNKKFVDAAVVNGRVYCLSEENDIFVYEKGLNHLRGCWKFEDAFCFKGLFGYEDNLYVLTSKGIKIVDEDAKVIKEVGKEAEVMVEAGVRDKTTGKIVDKVLAYSSDSRNSLRFIRKGTFKSFDKFPDSKTVLPQIKCLVGNDKGVIFSHGKYLSSVTLDKKNNL